ncbi:Serine/threonine-protein phosphatase 4 regulatory subunit 1 [Fukomys damarensis]|uniref:Serine/threonine-protein phosphatase 4 regulatory subunit 1 n=1 Tax=Fukomys damarensis TaxID=885580 RepID=A0A091DGS1_FUKDA|nr:Serine/threonine-protein phosphatase 4 regulatory subunit 1 [Fukomys damarensis]
MPCRVCLPSATHHVGEKDAPSIEDVGQSRLREKRQDANWLISHHRELEKPLWHLREDGFEDYGPDCDSMRLTAFLDVPSQDDLPPLTRLEKYAFSENIFNRQIIARGLLDIFRDFSNNEEDFLTIMEIAVRLSEDAEPTVRTELLEQIPPIAIFLRENRQDFPVVFSEYLMPVVVRDLADPDNQALIQDVPPPPFPTQLLGGGSATALAQVRKSSQEVLLILLEQDLIFQSDIENKVCSILLELSAPERDDKYRAEAMSIICKVASMLSKSTVERLLLPRFCELCGDRKLFQVRKVCATNFGDVCHAVGQEATEKFLLLRFFELCSDSVWGMRKACAECFMAVSHNTSPEVRRSQLSPLFIRLLSDPCRWVRQAAFQSLGPFISTFANPSRAGLYTREDGTLSMQPPSRDLGADFPSASPNPGACSSTSPTSSASPVQREPDPRVEGTQADINIFLRDDRSSNGLTENPKEGPALAGAELTRLSPEASAISKLRPTDDFLVRGHLDKSDNVFSTVLYWRTPLPDISKDMELFLSEAGTQEVGPESVYNSSCVARSEIQKVLKSLQAHTMCDPDVQVQVQVLSAALRAAQLDSTNEPESRPPEGLNEVSPSDPSSAPDNQIPPSASSSQNELSVARILQSTDVIPQSLLDEFVSMTDPARAQTVDTDIAKQCAYSLPGVALALGRQNWHCLKGTYETLASDVQWKVRRTLASSIHELAVILGDQLTAADLVPIFNGFLKDLDEVRIGVLKHLYDFLKAVVSEQCVPVDQFVKHLLPSLLSLKSDPVPNVRVLLAKALQQTLMAKAYFRNAGNPHLKVIEETVLALQSDRDQDVSFFATLQPKRQNVTDTDVLEKQTLDLVPDVFSVRVRLEETGEMFRVANCRGNMTVRELKEDLDLMVGIPFDLQRLQYLDQGDLMDNTTLKFHDVLPGSTLSLRIWHYDGWTDLVVAAVEGDPRASCARRSPVGRTALHVAAAMGCLDCTTLLVEHGASIHDRDAHGETPIAVARRLQHRQTEQRLFLLYWITKVGAKGPSELTARRLFPRAVLGRGPRGPGNSYP